MVRYLVEVSKSARSNCQSCKSKIGKGELRIGKGTDNGEFESVKYHHCGCWRAPRTVKSAEELEGFKDLDLEQQKEVKTQLEQPRKTIASMLTEQIKPGSEGELFTILMGKLSAAALKEILKMNGQPQDRLKEDLVAAVVDGMIKGAIPSCPKCGEGKLAYTAAGYNCSGSFDVSAKRFKKCNYSSKTVERTIWRMPAAYREQLQF